MVCEAEEGETYSIFNIGLNPCFNGIWSASVERQSSSEAPAEVLILVLMEYGLRVYRWKTVERASEVLILVLMEYGLRALFGESKKSGKEMVLILVLMEYGLRGSNL